MTWQSPARPFFPCQRLSRVPGCVGERVFAEGARVRPSCHGSFGALLVTQVAHWNANCVGDVARRSWCLAGLGAALVGAIAEALRGREPLALGLVCTKKEGLAGFIRQPSEASRSRDLARPFW